MKPEYMTGIRDELKVKDKELQEDAIPRTRYNADIENLDDIINKLKATNKAQNEEIIRQRSELEQANGVIRDLSRQIDEKVNEIEGLKEQRTERMQAHNTVLTELNQLRGKYDLVAAQRAALVLFYNEIADKVDEYDHIE